VGGLVFLELLPKLLVEIRVLEEVPLDFCQASCSRLGSQHPISPAC